MGPSLGSVGGDAYGNECVTYPPRGPRTRGTCGCSEKSNYEVFNTSEFILTKDGKGVIDILDIMNKLNTNVYPLLEQSVDFYITF